MSKVLFGYRHVNSDQVPLCPCRDPGNYLMLEQIGDDPLAIRFKCWCGRKNEGRFDSIEERNDFLKSQGVEVDDSDSGKGTDNGGG